MVLGLGSGAGQFSETAEEAAEYDLAAFSGGAYQKHQILGGCVAGIGVPLAQALADGGSHGLGSGFQLFRAADLLSLIIHHRTEHQGNGAGASVHGPSQQAVYVHESGVGAVIRPPPRIFGYFCLRPLPGPEERSP